MSVIYRFRTHCSRTIFEGQVIKKVMGTWFANYPFPFPVFRPDLQVRHLKDSSPVLGSGSNFSSSKRRERRRVRGWPKRD
ncbi:hypothetical protein TNCT_93571 [Trichonephila clavata]|uniref:Uncharacterized protein n=1 Tax=Trichonephila clavata TaxID=2740835 RepID=A0A8X6KW95_TRICU|nr:hypothetical protein TNCT_93571 [Trichonephila clavata]